MNNPARLKSPTYDAVFALNNSAKAKAAAAIEARWISELGDLSVYGLSARALEAVELRRDNPDLSYVQLAEQMGITKHAYTGLVRRLRNAVSRGTANERARKLAANRVTRAKGAAAIEARRIADLGDLSKYALRERWLRAAELRRDNPELLSEHLAEQMGITKGAFLQVLREFWVGINRGPTAYRLPPGQQRWLTGDEDLSIYKVSARVLQAVALCRENPELFIPQLAELMGTTPSAYSNLLTRFRMAVRQVQPQCQLGGQDACGSRPADAASIEARRIADLGNLSKYGLSERPRRAAELRRDNPELQHQQLAELMGVEIANYSGYLRSFWRTINREPRWSASAMMTAQWIANLGDLTKYPVSEQVRRAAELRRDHPNLPLSQLAARMGLTRGAYAAALRTFRSVVTSDPAAPPKPPLPRRVKDLKATVQRIEATRLSYSIAAG